jgi:type II secretion system protein N
MLFAPVYGTLNASVQLKSESSDAPQPPADQTKKAGKAAPVRRPTAQRGIDIQKLNGNLKIRIRNLLIGPGYFPTPQMGELPVPLLRLGTLALDLKIANGVANITKCAAVGQDGELHFTGSIQLRPDLRYSVLQGTLRFKIDKAFAEGPDTPDMLKLGIQALGSPKGDGFFHFQLRLPFSGQQPSFRQQ